MMYRRCWRTREQEGDDNAKAIAFLTNQCKNKSYTGSLLERRSELSALDICRTRELKFSRLLLFIFRVRRFIKMKVNVDQRAIDLQYKFPWLKSHRRERQKERKNQLFGSLFRSFASQLSSCALLSSLCSLLSQEAALLFFYFFFFWFFHGDRRRWLNGLEPIILSLLLNVLY